MSQCGRVTANGAVTVTGGSRVVVGDNCHFNGMSIIGAGGVTIGDNFHSGRGCKVFSVNHDFDGGDAVPYGRAVVEKPVVIGDNVWLGDDVLVMPGAFIGEGAVIGAGAVVAGRIEPCSVAVGNPARTIRMRDIAHYENLKAAQRFF